MAKQAGIRKSKVVRLPKHFVRTVYATTCPGCGYPLFTRIVLEALEEAGVDMGNTIAFQGGGCHHGIPLAFNCDLGYLNHGGACNQASAIKRLRPHQFVFTVQGDGDLMAVGTESLIHAATRGESITVLMLNNGAFGNTGGQMAPTTVLGQVTTTTPTGRQAGTDGYPSRSAELVAAIQGTAYSARGSVNSPANLQKTRKYIKRAFEKQMGKVGFSFVEVITMCPILWHLSPVDCLSKIDREIIPQLPLGEFKNVDCLV